MIFLATVMLLAGIAIAILWQYAYTPQGRARDIFAELKGDTTSPRGWLIEHKIIRRELPYPGPCDESGGGAQACAVSNQHEAVQKLAALGPQVLPVLFEVMKDTRVDVEVRKAAVQACGKMRDPQALGPLAQFVRDAQSSDWDVRFACVDAMGAIGGPEAIEHLRTASKDSNGYLRARAFRALVKCEGVSAVPMLIEAVKDKDICVRLAAVGWLGHLKDRRATQAVASCLCDPGPGHYVATAAAEALGELNDPESVPALVNALGDKTHRSDQYKVAGVLLQLGRKEGLDFMLMVLKTPYEEHILQAIDAIPPNCDKGVVDPLIAIAESDQSKGNPDLRMRLAQVLGRLGDRRAIPVLRKMLKDSSGEAAEALKKLGVTDISVPSTTAPSTGKNSDR